MSDPFRYGVFLRPSPELIEEALRGYSIVVDQFGFTAAASYPPHVTLVGSIAFPGELAPAITALDAVMAGQAPVPLRNTGIEIVKDSIGYQLEDADPERPVIHELMGKILEAIAPLRVFPPTDRTTALRQRDSPSTFRAHISLLGHDGADRPDQVRECFDVLTSVGIGRPSTWMGERVHFYRLRSDDWSDRYWETMTWELLKSWELT